MLNILVAVDGSAHANKALILACDLATKYRANLTIFHAQLYAADSATLHKLAKLAKLAKRSKLTKNQRDLLDNYELDFQQAVASAGGMIPVGFIPAPIPLLTIIGSQILDKSKATAKKSGVKKVKTVMAVGDASDSIIEVAKKEKSDAIVMGTRGLSDLKGFFMGSVSHKVAAQAKATCITVK
jgi:nucleotide-binding universal stress UspA family protein